ncbi:MAG: hypothetical protein AMXMBFR4_30370 [Candidatus Hydrogenedentota bacterium]
MSTRVRFLFVAAAALSISLFSIGCGGGESPAAPETVEQPAGTPAPTGEPATAPVETVPDSGGIGSNTRREDRDARFEERAAQTPPADAAPESPESEEMAEPPAQESESASDATEPTAQANPPADPSAPLTAETIVGTKWSVAGMVLAFEPNGVLKLNDTMDGTWKVDGNTLTVEAMGSSYNAQITGNSISYDGQALERIQ